MDSIRDALTAAIDKSEKDGPAADALETPAAIGTDSPGDSLPIGGDDTDTASQADESVPESGTGEPREGTAPVAEAQIPAPSSWTAAERAEWSKLSPGAQKAVQRREGEMQRAFQTSANARRRAEALDGVSAQYKPLMDRYGVTLEQVLPPLLATRAALEVGTASQKAELVANLCADFGIDIEQLDGALSARFANGQRPQPTQPPQLPDFSQNPALAPLFALAEQVKSHRSEQAAAVLAPITQQPYFEEVRLTMADLIDRARFEGRTLDVQKSYQIACSLHGFDAPASSAPVTASQAASILARSRNAASSVSGSPRPSPARKPGEGSVADEVSALMSARR